MHRSSRNKNATRARNSSKPKTSNTTTRSTTLSAYSDTIRSSSVGISSSHVTDRSHASFSRRSVTTSRRTRDPSAVVARRSFAASAQEPEEALAPSPFGENVLTEEQKKRAAEIDHRKLGREQELFLFHQVSPGSAFFLPHGTRVYNKLVQYLRSEYEQRGYQEVRTPQVFDKALWETSGHWENYKEDMFFVSKGKQTLMEAEKALEEQAQLGVSPVKSDDPNYDPYGHLNHHINHDNAVQALKPMNCPGHCVLYNTQAFSYRDLPIRYADFSNLHRNEASGSLSGLTRVRCFSQDDAHIFCRVDQLHHELREVLKFIQDVYRTFKFPVYYKLSTRPDDYIGDLQTWNYAEETLTDILNELGVKWELNPGDGAFYGPKVDVTVKDALGRYHQCATMQLDFNLPKRFNLEYNDQEGHKQQPVMVHRAIFGSIERFMAVLLEHTEGNWPLWISPRQVLVTSVSPTFEDYANKVCEQLQAKGIHAEVANFNERIGKQVKMAQHLKYNYIATIGANEQEHGTVTIRPRGHHKAEKEPVPVDQFIERILKEIDEKM